MNIADATTVEEIIKFTVFTGCDKIGIYHILTGYEGTGCCWWCGKKLTGQQKRYCQAEVTDDEFIQDILSDNISHWLEYWRHFCWPYARNWCLQRYNHQCANCGITQRHWEDGRLIGSEIEVHHIVPLEGIERLWSPYNLPWNLIALCYECHLEVHAIMREANKPIPPDIFDLALERGQLVFGALVGRNN